MSNIVYKIRRPLHWPCLFLAVQTLVSAFRAGALSSVYWRRWALRAARALQAHEAAAAPPGWHAAFNRYVHHRPGTPHCAPPRTVLSHCMTIPAPKCLTVWHWLYTSIWQYVTHYMTVLAVLYNCPAMIVHAPLLLYLCSNTYDSTCLSIGQYKCGMWHDMIASLKY